MVALSVLEQALRGGEQARQLEEKCKTKMLAAEQAVKESTATAPEYITETKSRHTSLLSDAQSLETQIEMLGESLEDITKRSQEMAERAQQEARKKQALDELATALIPFLTVANALEKSDAITELGFTELEQAITLLSDAVSASVNSQRPQLLRMVGELEERIDESTAMMKGRYMDTFEVGNGKLIAGGSSSYSGSSTSNSPSVASAALAKAGLLEDAVSGIVSELVRNEVAKGLAEATEFFEGEVDGAVELEWNSETDASNELLEFEFDDIEHSTDAETDAMTEHLDIANTASRALKIFDVLRDRVVGKDYSRQLAFAMQPWFSEHILPSSVVLASRRAQYANRAVPRESLRSRVNAVSACARVIQMAMRSRGAKSFVLVVEMDSLESKVGSECRAQAVLSSRKAIGNFSNAWHDDGEMATCPIAATKYIPRSERSADYFPPCLVTKAALVVHDVFLATRKDAISALQGGSTGIGRALSSAALECLRAYREDVPVQHAPELRSSLRLKALYYNDCMMFSHSCRMSMVEGGPDKDIEEEINLLEEAANKAMMVVRRRAEQRLVENLNAACRNGALGAYGTLIRIQRGSALSAAFNALREVVKVFAEVVATELAEIAAGRLLDKYLTTLCNEVVKLPEISADGCEQIDNILQDADRNVNSLMKLVSGMEVVRAGAPPPEVINQMRRCQQRLRAIREIMNARMEDIATNFRSGKYQGLISREEVEHFIRGIFEATPLRAGFIAELDVSMEQEVGEWNNGDW